MSWQVPGMDGNHVRLDCKIQGWEHAQQGSCGNSHARLYLRGGPDQTRLWHLSAYIRTGPVGEAELSCSTHVCE